MCISLVNFVIGFEDPYSTSDEGAKERLKDIQSTRGAETRVRKLCNELAPTHISLLSPEAPTRLLSYSHLLVPLGLPMRRWGDGISIRPKVRRPDGKTANICSSDLVR